MVVYHPVSRPGIPGHSEESTPQLYTSTSHSHTCTIVAVNQIKVVYLKKRLKN